MLSFKINAGMMETSFRVHFVYGSRPKKEFRKTEEKVPGGLFGGHISIQSGEYVYGFESIDRKRIHIFQKRKFNSIFTKEHPDKWLKVNNDQKMLSIEVPVDNEKLVRLNRILEEFHRKTPYDYAVFGMRCGASTYQILCVIGIFPPASRFEAMLRIPYPGILRRKLLRIAGAKNFRIYNQAGKDTRIWAKD
jgi:hypothetical protein